MDSWDYEFKKMHNSSLTSFIRPICFYLLNTQKKISDKWPGDFIMGILGLLGVCPGSPSWDGRRRRRRRRARWSWQQEENVLFHLLAWLGLVFSHNPGDHSHPGKYSPAHLCGPGRSPAGPRPLSWQSDFALSLLSQSSLTLACLVAEKGW